MTHLCAICATPLGEDNLYVICPQCYQEWNDDEDDDWADELDYLYPEMPNLNGEDIFFTAYGPPTGGDS